MNRNNPSYFTTYVTFTWTDYVGKQKMHKIFMLRKKWLRKKNKYSGRLDNSRGTQFQLLKKKYSKMFIIKVKDSSLQYKLQ